MGGCVSTGDDKVLADESVLHDFARRQVALALKDLRRKGLGLLVEE